MKPNQSFTPKETLSELDKYIVGQADAKRSVAIALRNRWRRRQVPSPLREEIAPKNIIMIGPTGVGKTEIARRLAALAQSPFIKVEASKYTEVGYVGRDVESMVRDLVDLAVNMVKEEEKNRIEGVAAANAEDIILDILLPPGPSYAPAIGPEGVQSFAIQEPDLPVSQKDTDDNSTREKFRKMLRDGKLDDREIEVSLSESKSMPMVEIMTTSGMEEHAIESSGCLQQNFSKKEKNTKDESTGGIGSDHQRGVRKTCRYGQCH